jgi:hypothetical protein
VLRIAGSRSDVDDAQPRFDARCIEQGVDGLAGDGTPDALVEDGHQLPTGRFVLVERADIDLRHARTSGQASHFTPIFTSTGSHVPLDGHVRW